MWLDNASEIDILFYDPYAEVIADIAQDKKYKPLTVGVFGVWGSGKSTLLNLVESKITDSHDAKNICVNINAWSFEGYEDAKIAVMETLLRELKEKDPDGLGKKIAHLIKRVDWLKLMTKTVGVAAPVVASAATGNPLPLVFGLNSAANIGDDVKKISDAIQSVRDDYMKSDDDASDNNSVVNNIRLFRSEFQNALKKENIDNIIVLIDDLDRCQPDRIIETLEAIKLFLSVDKTVFIIAADDNVIQYAINRKYPPLENFKVALDKEYIEKIIQLPIYIPELSEKDIKNYLMLLVAQYYSSEDNFKAFIDKIKEEKLLISDNAIDIQKVKSLADGLIDDEDEFNKTLDIVSGIRDIIASNLKGNPRQAKRFLNTFITKKRLAELYYGDQDGALDPKILAKLLVLQKLDETLFIKLNEWNKKFSTINDEYKKMRESISSAGDIDEKYKKWHLPAIKKWVLSDPVNLENERLDRYFYLTRELLKTSTIDESKFTQATRDILQQFGRATRGTIKKIVSDLNELTPSEINDVFNTILPKIAEGEVEMYICRDLFNNEEEYRIQIADALSKRTEKIGIGDVPAISEMRKTDEKIIDNLLDEWSKTHIIDDISVEKIRNTRKQ